MANKLDHETLVAWVTAQRARQGLPPYIEDPGELARLCVLLRAGNQWRRRQNEEVDRGGAAS